MTKTSRATCAAPPRSISARPPTKRHNVRAAGTTVTTQREDSSMALSDAIHLAKFLATHTYSKAPEAFKKQAIDGQILAQDFSKAGNINIADEGYLKELIKLASAGARSV